LKKLHIIIMTALLTIGLVACGTPATTITPTIEASQAPAIVAFADPVLEEIVRGAMGKPVGDITVAEAQAITRMDFSNAWSQYLPQDTLIHDLSGLEAFTNLESLDLV